MKKIFVPLLLIVGVILFAFVISRKGHQRVPDVYNSEGIYIETDENSASITIIGQPSTMEEDSLPVTVIVLPSIDKKDKKENKDAKDRKYTNISNVGLAKMVENKPEQILHRTGYTTSYNSSTKNANWVAWHLTREHTDGRWSRKGIPYMVDKDIKGPRQELEDWDNHSLPIDHGHLCPAGDNKWSREAMEQTFLLSNMCPQNSDLNQGDWEKLESRCRGWAKHYGDIYIVTGPIFYSNSYKTIGANKVGVPDAFFKVVLCISSKKPKALGFIYPNEGTHHKMDFYVLSVDEVESKTGIDFFSELPDSIENKVESFADITQW